MATHAALARGTMPLPGAPARFTPAALGEGGPAGDSPRRAREEEKAVKVPEGAAPGAATSLAQALVARPESMPPPAPFEPRASAALSPAAEAALPAALPGQAGQVDGALLRSAAHLRVETPALGELELHLRIREGTAHLRVEGEGARHLEAQAGDLSRSLAGEGLKLGRLELSAPPAAPDTDRAGAGSPDARREGAGGNRHSFEEPPPPPPSRPPPAPGRPGAHTGGRIHVKA